MMIIKTVLQQSLPTRVCVSLITRYGSVIGSVSAIADNVEPFGKYQGRIGWQEVV